MNLRRSYLPVCLACCLFGSLVANADPTAPLSFVRDEQAGANVEFGQPISLSGPGYRISQDGADAQVKGASRLDEQSADRDRRVDVTAAQTNVALSFDSLAVSRSLSAIALPVYVTADEQVTFVTHSNYTAFVHHAEIRLFPAGSNVKGKPLKTWPVELNAHNTWYSEGLPLGEYIYVLRVADKSARFDETIPLPLSVGARRFKTQQSDQAPLAHLVEDNTAVRHLPLEGGTVTARVAQVPDGHEVRLMGQTLPVDEKGLAYGEMLLPFGRHDVLVEVVDENNTGAQFVRPLEIIADDTFFVGLADLTIGQQDINGQIERSTGPDTQLENNFINGRLAFYYKGRIKGKYLTTIAADTEEERIEDLFDNFGRKDARSFLRRIDPQQFYPVYGDDSTTVEDAPSAGNLYVRIERNQTSFIWGDFQTSLSGMELVQYSRSLYGANFSHSTVQATTYGEAQTQLSVFAADPGTIASRDEFRGSGGTLYYLRRQDVTEGSERVFIEIRDRDSQLVLSRQELISATDYDLNYIQGRISLRSPLPSTADGTRFVRDGNLSGNPAYLVVTYEFTPTITEPDTFSAGGRVHHWFGDHVGVGIVGFDQGDKGFEQTLAGGDLTLRYDAGTYLRVEKARSNGPGNGAGLSSSGGLSFNYITPFDTRADAHRAEIAVNLAEITETQTGTVEAYWQEREAGFSAPGQITGNDAVDQYGVQTKWQIDSHTDLLVKGDSTSSRGRDQEALEAGVQKRFGNGWYTNVGGRYDTRQFTTTTASTTLNESGSRTDLNVLVGFDTQNKDTNRVDTQQGEMEDAAAKDADVLDWGGYLFAQGTVSQSGQRSNNDRFGVGGRYRFTKRFSANAELSDGNLGSGALLGSEYNYSDRGTLYLSHTLEAENPDAFNSGRLGRSTMGVRNRFNDAVSLFAETRREAGAGPTGTTQQIGIDFTPYDKWLYAITYETGTLSDPLGGDIERDAATVTIGYSGDETRLSTTLEYRQDNNPITGNLDIIAARGIGSWQVTPATRVHAKLHMSKTASALDPTFDAEFSEYVLAAAYRPIVHDRLNVLFKYTYLEDLPSPAQVSALGVPIDFAQRGHVAAIDATFQLTRSLALGAKYAYRLGELRPSRDSSASWFDSRSDFVAVRADWYFVESWDLLLEARRLTVYEADDSRTGVLAALHRHVGNHMKVGIGYNFTDFTDDLTDLSYDSRGVFLNVIGVF